MRIVFAGPSLAGRLDDTRRSYPDLTFAGPAVWGDVARAVVHGAKVIGIIDGCFEQTRAVWHKEILYALSQGVEVAGAASMGALRAAECAAFGMVGIGQVFEAYHRGELTDDSDVALVHAPAELGYQPLSEPRVNLRATLHAMRVAGILSSLEYRIAKATAERLHYSELNHVAVIRQTGIGDLQRQQRLIAWASRHRVDVKQQDALALIDWIRARPRPPVVKPGWTFSESSQWQALMHELRTASASPR